MKTPILASLAVALCAAGCGGKPAAAETPATPANEAWLTPQQVKEAKLAIAPLVDQSVGGAIVTGGKVTFDDLRVAHVYSPVTGRVVRIDAQPGQRVKKGASLVVIESPDVGTATSDLAKAQADLAAGEHDFKRQKELFEAHAGSQKDYESAEDTYGKAKAELQRALAKVRLLRTGAGSVDSNLQQYTLRAPIDGEVIARAVNPGVEVQGQYSGGTPVELFTIGELDQVWVIADLYEQDFAQVKKASRVSVRVVSYPSKIFEGHVDWVSDSLDPATRTAKVRCAIKNPDRDLKPEMTATVSVSVDERKALAIPHSALLRLGDQTMVFIKKPDESGGVMRFERRPVAVDEDQGGDYLPVIHGIEANELVVVSGAILLSGAL